MTQDYKHPITPPPELVRQWMERTEYDEDTWFYESYIAEQAAQWGANQELEACVKWLDENLPGYDACEGRLRAARRPKPASLKEQAIAELDDAVMRGDCITVSDALPTIRRALASLPDTP
jgi:hypothetical protein